MPEPRRVTVAEYQRLIALDFFGPDEQVELLEGLLVQRPRPTPPHATGICVLNEVFRTILPEEWGARTRLTLELVDSQPEPDLTVVLGNGRKYMTRHPTAADTALAIEVADVVLQRERGERARMYARSGVPVYWIVNLVDRRVEVLTDPSGPTALPAYASATAYAPGSDVPLLLPGAPPTVVPSAELLL